MEYDFGIRVTAFRYSQYSHRSTQTAPTLSSLRQKDGMDETCSMRKDVKYSYTVLLGKCEGRGPRRARIYRGQGNVVMDARKI